MNQGHTGSKHQGREKLTADQSVADFQDWIAYFADVRNETSLEQCLSTLSWEAHIRVHRSTSSPLNIINFSSQFLNTFKHIPIDAPRDFSHLLYTRIASDTRSLHLNNAQIKWPLRMFMSSLAHQTHCFPKSSTLPDSTLRQKRHKNL